MVSCWTFLHLTFFLVQLICTSHSSMLSFFFPIYFEFFCISHSSVFNFFTAWTFCTHPLSVQQDLTLFTSPLIFNFTFVFCFCFWVCNEPFRLAHHSEKNGGSIWKYRVPSLWPIYVGERRTTFAKAYGTNVRCYWELFEELGNSFLWPLPHPKRKKHSWKVSTLSTLHTKTQLEKSSPSAPPHPQDKKGGPFTSWHDFSLVAWKFYF